MERLVSQNIRVIGLTGGIATGKSFVARFFMDKGIPVIDADQLARDAVQPGTDALNRIADLFGAEGITADGTLDRKRLAALVFADPGKRRLLESIIHPEIRRLAEARIAHYAATGRRQIIYMAPLLIEAGVSGRVDEIWVVTVRPEIQLERLMGRDGIGREQAAQMIASQMPLAEKESFGRVVIDNSGSESDTLAILESVWAQEMENDNG